MQQQLTPEQVERAEALGLEYHREKTRLRNAYHQALATLAGGGDNTDQFYAVRYAANIARGLQEEKEYQEQRCAQEPCK